MSAPLILEESGLVIRIENEFAWVNTQSKMACSSCQVESTCGSGILEKYLGGKVFVSKVKNEIDAKVGDKVVIAIPRSRLTRAALIAYGLPLFGLMLGAALGHLYYASEPATIFTALLGLLVAFSLVKLYNAKITASDRYTPKLITKSETGYSADVFESIKIKQLD